MGLVLAAALLSGCISLPEQNGALGLTRPEAAAAAERMKREPVGLERPVVILNGYRGLPTLAARVASALTAMTSGERGDFLTISYWWTTDLDAIAAEVVRQVDDRWPSEGPQRTVEVDVVAISMGGLVARWAALPPEQRVREGRTEVTPEPATPVAPGKRLRIARLFTMGSPHRGAAMADVLRPDRAAQDMHQGSGFLATLDGTLGGAEYELVCYAQLRDHLVGATRAAPVGREPIWTSGTFIMSHFTTHENPLFLTDIARRLRGEEPLLRESGPPPGD
jgi:pimeloyl-ACP methyl ester carboxylesterase